MGGHLVELWRRHPVLLTGFVLATGLMLFFAVRMVMVTLHWSDPMSREQAIEGWMPLRYVGRSWDVPPEVLGQAVGREPEPGARLTVAEIAAASGRSVDAVSADLQAAIAAYRLRASGE
jgi:hypothetical protein